MTPGNGNGGRIDAGGARPHRVEPLWARIDRNGPKMALYLLAFMLSWALAAELLLVLPAAVVIWWSNLTHGRATQFAGLVLWAQPLLFVLGAGYALLAARRPERVLLARLGAQRVPTGEVPETKHALHDMAIATGLTYPPPLYVLETRAVNAFVLGRRPDRAAVGVTRGLLRELDADEQRAVFANLLTRLHDGDVFVGTIVSSLMSPEWVWRRAAMSGEQDGVSRAAETAAGSHYVMHRAGGPVAFLLLWWTIAAFVTEFLYFGQMQQQILTCEAADAKGMLLLKEPRAMLSALEKVLPADNAIPSSAAQLAPLFFAWTGDAYCDERDPEMRRISRLREVLGVEGMPRVSSAETEVDPVPPAPRLEA